MHVLNPETVQQRKKKILQTVICHYVQTDKPVSSRIICENYPISFSSATIRNLIAELEKEGYLKRLHSSSGCVPTDKGYRNFVDSLMELQNLAIDERKRINEEFKTQIKEFDELFFCTSHLLAGLSHCAGFVIAPKLSKNLIKHLQIIKLDEKQLLLVIITQSGLVKHQAVKIDFPVNEKLLENITCELNDKFTGSSLNELKLRLPEIIEDIKSRQSAVERLVKTLSSKLFESGEDEIFIDGTSNIISMLAVKDYKRIYSLMQLIEQKKLLIQLLDKDLKKFRGVEVTIGKEHSVPEFEDISLVRTTYKSGENPVGVLGIIGPKRMEYPKMISLVDFIAKILNKMLAEFQ